MPEKLEKPTSVRFTEGEKAVVAADAKAVGLSVNAYIRYKLGLTTGSRPQELQEKLREIDRRLTVLEQEGNVT